MAILGYMGDMLGLYWDNGKNGNYYSGVVGCGV